MSKFRSGNVLVLKQQEPDSMVFEFRGGRWSIITFVLALAVGFGLYTVADQSKYPELLKIIAIVAAVLFLYSSLYSFSAKRILVINGRAKMVSYTHKDLYRSYSWQQPITYFKELRIFRNPISTSAGKSAFLRLSLVAQEGNNIILGTSELGIAGKSRARQLGEHVSSLTGLPLIVEKGFQI